MLGGNTEQPAEKEKTKIQKNLFTVNGLLSPVQITLRNVKEQSFELSCGESSESVMDVHVGVFLCVHEARKSISSCIFKRQRH